MNRPTHEEVIAAFSGVDVPAPVRCSTDSPPVKPMGAANDPAESMGDGGAQLAGAWGDAPPPLAPPPAPPPTGCAPPQPPPMPQRSTEGLECDYLQASQFLRRLDPSATTFTFQTFDDNADRKSGALAKVLVGTLDEYWHQLVQLNHQGAGVFVTINETDGKGRRKENITRIRAIWQEDDEGDAPVLPCTSHIAVQSSPGKYHRYVLTEGPGADLDQFEPVQLRMVEDYGSDPNAKDRARVMRLPGFYHQKVSTKKGLKGAPARVTLLGTSSEQPLPWQQLVELFPPVNPAQKSDRAAVRHLSGATTSVAGPPPAQPTDTITWPAGSPPPVDSDRYISAKSWQDLWSALLAIPADGYETWVRVGLALQSIPHDGGWVLWNAWSQTCPEKYPGEEEARQKWSNDLADGGSHWKAVFNVAKEHGWKNPGPGRRETGGPDAADKPKLPPPTMVDLSELETATLDPPQFVIEPLVPRGYTTLFSGHGGSGKSILALTWAAYVACGRSWGPFRLEAGRVMFLSMEDPAKLLLYRLRRICESHHLPYDKVMKNLILVDGTESEPLVQEVSNEHYIRVAEPTDTVHWVERRIEEIDLLIVDNASDAFDGNENERRQVRSFIRILTKLVRDHDGAVLLLAHIDKAAARFGSNGNSYSGSTAWHNSSRSRITLIDSQVVHEKLNVGRVHPDPVSVVWNDDGVLMYDPGGVTRKAAQDARDAEDDAVVLKALQACWDRGVTVTAAASGPATTWHLFKDQQMFGNRVPEKDAKKRLNAALDRLKERGQVRVEEFLDDQRKKKKKLMPGSG